MAGEETLTWEATYETDALMITLRSPELVTRNPARLWREARAAGADALSLDLYARAFADLVNAQFQSQGFFEHDFHPLHGVSPLPPVRIGLFGRPNTKLYVTRGVGLLVCARAGLATFEYPPARVKRAVVGAGRAEKAQVAQMVRILLGLSTTPPADAADALAIAVTHLQGRALQGARAPIARAAGDRRYGS